MMHFCAANGNTITDRKVKGQMAYIITAVGAGGKTTLLEQMAGEYVLKGRKVAFTTTTHIWNPAGSICETFGENESWVSEPGSPEDSAADSTVKIPVPVCRREGIDYFGIPQQDGKLSAPSAETWDGICREYDVILVEGDGSHSMPVKIPGAGEPVIPDLTDEMIVVMGGHAVGRRLDIVCHRYDKDRIRHALSDGTDNRIEECGTASLAECGDGPLPGNRDDRETEKLSETIVTPGLLKKLADVFYIRPIQNQYPDIRIRYFQSDLYHSGCDTDVKKVTLVLMASGFGRRYGGNKLLEQMAGKPMYRHVLDRLSDISDACNERAFLKSLPGYGYPDVPGTSGLDEGNLRYPECSVVVVTQYDQIRDQIEADSRMREEGVKVVINREAEEGIAASIRIGTRAARENGSDAVVFFAADMPFLPGEEIALYLRQFLCSGKAFACMESGQDHTMTNPGAFRLNRKGTAEALGGLTGDRGAMKIMKQRPWDIYRYQVPEEYVRDIDERDEGEFL